MQKRIIVLFAVIAVAALGTHAVLAYTPAPAPPPAPIIINPGQYCEQTGFVNIAAPWYCSQINIAAIQIWDYWEPIAMAVVLISFMLAAVIIMIGVGIHSDRVRIFGTGELYEAVATAIIVGMFTVVAAVMFGIVPSLFVGQYNPYVTSLDYINSTINSTGHLMLILYQIGADDYFYASQSLSICVNEGFNSEGVPQPYACEDNFQVFPALFKYAVVYLFFWPASALMELIVPGLMVLELEFYLIIFMMYAAIPVFLVPGIIFRAIIPTRQLGGMLMAIAIGFYFIMPILFSFAFAQTLGTQDGVIAQMNAVTTSLGKFGGCTVGVASCPSSVQNSISPSSPLIEEIGDAPSALGAFWLSIIFYPALISAMTYALITQIAELLGGMARTSSRLRGI